MCLYIITQQAGAALHRILDEGQREKEKESVYHHISSQSEGRVHVHTLHTVLKSILTFFHSFQKPTADVSLRKIIYVKTKW